MSIRMLVLTIPILVSAQAPVPSMSTPDPAPPSANFTVDQGTRVPMNLMNPISTRNAQIGDRAYLETIFPILINGRIVIPAGSYVAGTVTQVKRAGRVKGKAELFVRFDSLTLPNGVTRDFRARVGNIDGSNTESVDRAEGKIKGDSSKGQDAMTVAGGAMAGASVGGLATWSRTGGLVGLGAGAAAGMIGVLASRGPDATLERGTTVEMVLDRNLSFSDQELDFSRAMPGRTPMGGPGEMPRNRSGAGVMVPGRRW